MSDTGSRRGVFLSPEVAGANMASPSVGTAELTA